MLVGIAGLWLWTLNPCAPAQVTYSARVARLLHAAPLAAALALAPRGRLRACMLHAALYFAGLAGAVLAPALLGAVFVALTGAAPTLYPCVVPGVGAAGAAFATLAISWNHAVPWD